MGRRASVQRVHRLGVVAHVGLLGHCTVEGSVLLRLNTRARARERGTSSGRRADARLASSSREERRPSYLSHGRLPDLVRVLPDALQEVLQVRHGHLLDVLAQSGEVFSHNLAEAVLADPAAEKQPRKVKE